MGQDLVMAIPKINLRDLFWLIVVVALALGWWIDLDRIRREREALTILQQEFLSEKAKHLAGLQRVTLLKLKLAEAVLQMADAELASAEEVHRKNPSAIPENELRRLQAQSEVARLELEQVQAREELLRTR
jgi:hypothetical protein